MSTSKTPTAAPAPAAAAAPEKTSPAAGGRYEVDPATGALRCVAATEAAEHLSPNPAFAEVCQGAAGAAPADTPKE